MNDIPLACSLSLDDLGRRRRDIADLVGDALLERVAVPGGLRARFRRDPGTEAALERLVAAERECCPFLDLAIERGADELVLVVRGPSEAEALVGAFLGSP